MRLNRDEAALLGAHDDDWYGLWEVDWYFNGAHPEWSRETRTALVVSLVQQGLLDIFFGPLMTERPPLPLEIALKSLTGPAAWAPPADGQETGYYAITNSAGITALKASA